MNLLPVEIIDLSRRLGLEARADGLGWRLFSTTGVALFMVFMRAAADGTKRFTSNPVLDLGAL